MVRAVSTVRMLLAAGIWGSVSLVPVLAESSAQSEFDFGPFVSRLKDVNGDTRLRVLGPIFEATDSPEGNGFTAIRPFYSRAEDAQRERTNLDFVWPLCTAKTFRDELSWRFLTVFYLDYDRYDSESRYHVWAFPFYAQGRDKFGAEYVGLFPFFGQVNEFLGRDYINFLLFPIWARHSINGVDTREFLWPIVSHTSGKGIHRFRVFPFYSQSKHRDRFSKRFILWPFWTWAEYRYPSSRGSGYVLFPFWGHIKMSDEETWFAVPPFFRFSRGDRLDTVYSPWPFIQYKSGEEEKMYIFPFWGKKSLRGNYKQIVLWPIFHRERIDKGTEFLRRFWAVPFWYSDQYVSRGDIGKGKKAGELSDVYYKLWPLGSYRREGDVSRFRTLELWPYKNSPPMERNYAPFWTLYTRSSIGSNLDSEMLWGMYRHRKRDGGERYVSVFPLFDWHREVHPTRSARFRLFKGLFGYQREGDAKQIQLLYLFRFGDEQMDNL